MGALLSDRHYNLSDKKGKPRPNPIRLRSEFSCRAPIEQCGLAFALFRSLDAAFHAFQECVAVNGINERSELGRKLDCMAARSDLEVGNVGGARDIDVLENS